MISFFVLNVLCCVVLFQLSWIGAKASLLACYMWQVLCDWKLKLYIRSIGPSMFEAEALGLEAMYETGTICVPKPYKVWILNIFLWLLMFSIYICIMLEQTWVDLLLGVVVWTSTYWWFFHHHGIHTIWCI